MGRRHKKPPPPAGYGTGDADQPAETGEGKGRAAPQRDRMLALLDDVELWHDSMREPHATLLVDGHRENWHVRSHAFRLILTGRFLEQTGAALSAQSFEEVLSLLEARAVTQGPCHETFIRVGQANGYIYHDLCDADWRVVEIRPDGWAVRKGAPCKFLRRRAMLDLPEPEGGADIGYLSDFVNVSGEPDFMLVVAYLVAALRPQGPFPILVLSGQQGSAKSFTTEVIRALLDPNVAAHRSPPRDERDLYIGAHNNWCLPFDNLSGVANWLSDALCRLSTDGAFATRELHSDLSETIIQAARPVILNGIAELGGRPDLADRALFVTAPPIPDAARVSREQKWGAFLALRPQIMGVLYDGVSNGLANLAKVKLDELPRMADFALWIAAAAPGLGFEPDALLAAYTANRQTATEDLLANDPLAAALLDLVDQEGYEGTATDLLAVLDTKVPERERKQRSWPTGPKSLSQCLSRIEPALRARGVRIERYKIGTKARTRMLRIYRPA